jgi:serine/threonine-protein kinase RsbW
MDGGLTWLQLPAALSSLDQFTEFVHVGARQADLAESQLVKLDLVLEELLVNVFRYAYPAGEPGEVAVGYTVPAPKRLRVDVCDSGRPFNPLENQDPDVTLSLAARQIGGMGVYLVKTIANSVSYKREHGQNVLSFQLQ